MKNNKRKLDLIVSRGIIDLEDFYSVSFSESEITLQGKYSGEKANKYKHFSLEINPVTGYVQGMRYNTVVTLTE